MSQLLPNLLRAVISTTANVLLMMTLLQPKYSKKVTLLAMLGILAADLGTAIYCYLSGNLTLLSKVDIILFAVLCFAVRPLFKDTFMQWLFSYLTVQNISDVVIILSFIGSRHLPYPAYANSLLRIILFGAFLLILSRYVRPASSRTLDGVFYRGAGHLHHVQLLCFVFGRYRRYPHGAGGAAASGYLYRICRLRLHSPLSEESSARIPDQGGKPKDAGGTGISAIGSRQYVPALGAYGGGVSAKQLCRP
jgi:hypothetical protein